MLISAGTMAEALIVSARRNVGEEISNLIDGFGFRIVSASEASARRIAQAYEQWEKAGLNFGDCFAYDVAKQNPCRLLYVAEDFSRTHITGAL